MAGELEPRKLGYTDPVTEDPLQKIGKHGLSAQEELDALAFYEQCYAEGKSFLGPHHTTADENEEFAFKEQWDKAERREREGDPTSKRPCLTFNKTLRIGKRIVNDVKQAKFGIKYVPVDNGADPIRAMVYNTVVRKIERDNRCETIRQVGFEQALFGGFGFWRVYTDWDHEMSFEKKIVTKRIVNRKQVLFSKASIEPDLSDCTWFIVHEVMALATAKSKFPKVDFSTTEGSDMPAAWSDGKEGVVISEQFCLKYKPATLIRFSSDRVMKSALVDDATKAMWQAMSPDGYPEQLMWQSDLTDEQKILWEALPQAYKKTVSRPGHKKVWVWYKFAGRQIIKTQDWDGSIAPIVFCRGREVWFKGERSWQAITTWLKDPQRLYNYYRSTQSERMTIAADAPWLLTAEHIAGYEQVWKTAHTRPLRYLLYNLKGATNEELPAPQRTQPITGDPGLDREVERLDQEMLDIAGMNLASLGEPSGERTGKAILVRQRQGELVNADYSEGYIEALHREGQIYLDLIPKTYTWEQAMALLSDEDKELAQQIQEKGISGWGNGRYDLEIEIGSVSSTVREDEKQFWTDMIQANPQVAPLVMDKLVETMGSKHSKVIGKRFQAMLPPQAQGITETSDGNQPNPEVQQIQQQAQQQMEQMGTQMQEMQAAGKELQTENETLKMDNTVKIRELDIKEQELAIKREELQIKKIELELKYGAEKIKLGLEAKRVENESRNASNGSSENKAGNVQA